MEPVDTHVPLANGIYEEPYMMRHASLAPPLTW